MSREIRNKINRVKREKDEKLRERVAATLERFGLRLLSDEEVEQESRIYDDMWRNMTRLEREDFEFYVAFAG